MHLGLAAALALPAVVRAHRDRLRGALLVALAASAGALRASVALRAAAVDAAAAPRPVRIEAEVLSVRTPAWRPRRNGPGAGPPPLEMDLRVRGGAGAGDGPPAGSTWRVLVGEAQRRWRPGLVVRVRLQPLAVRGFCNGGVDRRARALARAGLAGTARLATDRAIEVIGGSRSAGAILGAARQGVDDAIGAAASTTAAPILRAILTGDARGVPVETRRAWAATGTAHVLAVSGLHLSIVAGVASFLCGAALVRSTWVVARAVPARLAALAAIAPAAVYARFTGAATSTARALAMFVVAAGGVAIARRAELPVSLAFAALALAAHDPGVVLDPSFQLSFAAVAGIGAVAARTAGGAGRTPGGGLVHRALRGARDAILVTLGATAATAPVLAATFGSVSAAGVVANLAVVPLVGTVALLAGLLGALLLPFARVPGTAALAGAGLAVDLADAVVRRCAELPLAAVRTGPPSLPALAAWAGAWALFLARTTRGRRRAAGLLGLGLLAWAAGRSVLPGAAAHGEGLRLAFLDVGQGDSAIVDAGGIALVVDGGGLPGTDTGTSIVVPALRALGISRVRALATSHGDLDHEGGLPAVAAELAVEESWAGPEAGTGESARALAAALAAAGVPGRRFVAGQVALERPAVEVLGPPASRDAVSTANDRSLVLAVRQAATRIVLPGDVERAGERALLRGPGWLGGAILKVPHHGSRSSSGSDFLRAVRPALAVASAGWRNRFGHPAAEVRRRAEEAGALWLETDLDGAVELDGDGQLLTVTTCRPRRDPP